MDFRILGPLEVREDEGEVRLGRGKQRALLALLLLHRDEAISTDRIIDELWGEQPPATAAKIVQNYVLQLRRALEDGGSADADLITQGRGYLLRVERGRLDLDRFEALVEAGERALGSGDAAQAAETLREALALWRGPPLADFAYEPFAQAAIERLEDQRLAALERRIEADLALGRHADVVGELKELVSVHPLHEGFRAQLMLALYHSGRQAQALEVYRDARRSLVEELGIDPSPALQQLEQAILRQEVPPAASRPPPPAGETRDPAPAVVADAPAGEGRESRGADLRTFLIADIRGYTRFSQDHGDGAASRLAHRFADIVREAIPTEVGELLELRGDEALCVFSSAREALQTAVELQRRFRARVNGEPALPLGVGVGLDAGEAIPTEGGYRGRALNVAARLSALAQPGEILASETVVSLAGHQEGASYARRRPARLKGLAEPVRHVAVVPDVALPPLPPPLPAQSARRRGLLLLAAGALVLTGTVTAAILTLTRDADVSVESIGNAIAAIDGDGGAVSYTEAGNTPSTIAVGEGAVWVLNAGDRTLSKIDPETRRIVKTFGTGGTTTDLAVGEGAVWVGNGDEPGTLGGAYTTSVSRLDPDSTEVTGTRVLPGGQAPEAGLYDTSRILGVSQLAAGAGGVWAINPDLSVSRIDPDTLELVAKIPVTAASAIAAGREGVWVIGGEDPLVQIDPRTNKVGQTIDLEVGDQLAGLALGAGSVWATDLETGLLWRVEADQDPGARTIDVGSGATAVAFGAGAVWVTNFVSDEVVRVDPDTNEVTARIPLAGTPPSVAAGPDTAWVSIAGAPGGEVLPASVCGAVLAGTDKPDVLIASSLPLQGSSGEFTRIVADAVRFVLREHGFRAGRHTVGYQSCDDSTAQTGAYDFLKCASDAKAYVATARLVGVIGPWDSPCASAQIPITNRAEEPLAMISPSNTDAGLTHAHAGGGDDQPGIYYPSGVRNYVRVIGPVDFEAAAGAVLAQELGLRRVYVLRSPTGYDFVKSPFMRAAGELGIAIAGSSTWADDAKTYDALAERIARARPDGIFIAGFTDPNAGALLKALRARLGPRMKLFTGEYTRPSDVLREAPRAAIGMYISSTARAPASLGPAGQAFLREFAKTQPGVMVRSAFYIAEAAQATEVLLQAIARSDGTRASVTRELRRVKVENGILGSFEFDRNGDMTPAAVTIFRITGAKNRDPDDYFAGAEVDRVVRVPTTLVAP